MVYSETILFATKLAKRCNELSYFEASESDAETGAMFLLSEYFVCDEASEAMGSNWFTRRLFLATSNRRKKWQKNTHLVGKT